MFPVRYIVSRLKSEHVFKMAARVITTSSEEMASTLEDFASEDPVIHHSEHKCEYDCHQICRYFQILFSLLTSLNGK